MESTTVLTISDIIQIVGICVALFTGVVSIIISIIALCQNSKIIKESNMAQIEIFPFKLYGDIVPRIKIQNFGNTTGVITDVKVNKDIPNNVLVNPFDYYVGLSLAPKQSFITVFVENNSPNVPIDDFDVTITYKTLKKTIKSTFHINYKFLDGTFEISSPSKDASKALDKINQSIQGLQQR